eukprot:6468482-Amphidinium_carterae.1
MGLRFTYLDLNDLDKVPTGDACSKKLNIHPVGCNDQVQASVNWMNQECLASHCLMLLYRKPERGMCALVYLFSLALANMFTRGLLLCEVSQSIQVHTRMVWVESPTNPLLDLVDIEKLVEHIRIFERLRKGHAQVLVHSFRKVNRAHATELWSMRILTASSLSPYHLWDSLAPDEKRVKLDELASRILVCVDGRGEQLVPCKDNTFATAYNQRPLTLGADIVMLSSSNLLGLFCCDCLLAGIDMWDEEGEDSREGIVQSRYVGGHSDMTGGALITADQVLGERLDALKSAVSASGFNKPSQSLSVVAELQ